LKILGIFEVIDSMTKNANGFTQSHVIGVVLVLLIALGSVVAFSTGLFTGERVASDGLSGLVSVKGTVKLEDLALSRNEVVKINRAVEEHRDTFTQIGLFLDAKSLSGSIDDKTVLVWAMVLETNGDCEVRSWSRKVARADLVPQMVLYMTKAAREYEQFKKFPDVKQDFKCLYI
jgi:hypothetical protein